MGNYDYDTVYYSPYKSFRDDKITVIRWQWFDFNDYSISHFFVEHVYERSALRSIRFATENDDVLKFESRVDAIKWINKNIKPHLIDAEYIQHNVDSINDYLIEEQ